MWLQTNLGMYSIVVKNPQDEHPSPCALIRAREEQALRNLLDFAIDNGIQGIDEHTQLHATIGRDYAYRLILPVPVMRALVGALVTAITYPNFKSECHRQAQQDNLSPAYIESLHTVWSVFERIQPYLAFSRIKRRKKHMLHPEEDKAQESDGMLVEDSTLVGGVDVTTGADVVRPKVNGKADAVTEATDKRENA